MSGKNPWSLGFGGRSEPCEAFPHRKRCLDPLLDCHSPKPLEFGPQRGIGTRASAATGDFHLCFGHAPSMGHPPGMGKHRTT